MFKTTLTLVVCGMALSAGAQKAQTQPVMQKTFRGVSMNTNDFYPQIDEAYTDHAPKHEQPPLFTPEGPPNGQRGGEIQHEYPRGTTGPLYAGLGATGYVPPDVDLAVGPNDVVETVNLNIGFFNKTTGASSFTQGLSAFFSGIGIQGGLSDPKCFYDRVHGRFVVCVLEIPSGTYVSKLLVAVSDDSNPSGTWYKYRLEAQVSGSWLDYPGFGYCKDGIVATGNLFTSGGGFAGTSIMAMPIANMLTGGAVTVTYFTDGSGSFQVAEMIDAAATNVYIATRTSSTNLKIRRVATFTTTPTISTATNVTVASASDPSIDAPSTSGRTLDSLDGRPFNVVYRGGRLLLARNYTNGSQVGTRWYELNMSAWPTVTVTQQGGLANASASYHMGAINKNSAGDISVIYTRSSSTITADIVYSSRAAADAAGTMGAPNLLESSLGNNPAWSTPNRWGDYFGIDVDPVDDVTFWGAAMNVSSGNNWRTSFFKWTLTPPGPQLQTITLDQSTVFNGVGTTGHANITQNVVSNTNVTLVSSNPAAVTVPASVTVLAGTSTASFAVSTLIVAAPVTVTISGTMNSVTQQAQILVNPPLLTANAVAPAIVSGGASTTGTVTLDYVAQGAGAIVSLTSSNPAVAQVPATVTVPAGSLSANYNVTTANPAVATGVTLTATYFGTNRQATLTVNRAVVIAHPISFTLGPGSQYAGSTLLPGVQASDDSWMIVRPGAVFSNSQYPIVLTFTSNISPFIPSLTEFFVESSATAAGINQLIEIWVPSQVYWDQVSLATISTSDGVFAYSSTLDPDKYIDATTGDLVVRLSYKATSAVFTFPWRVKIDEIYWRFTP